MNTKPLLFGTTKRLCKTSQNKNSVLAAITKRKVFGFLLLLFIIIEIPLAGLSFNLMINSEHYIDGLRRKDSQFLSYFLASSDFHGVGSLRNGNNIVLGLPNWIMNRDSKSVYLPNVTNGLDEAFVFFGLNKYLKQDYHWGTVSAVAPPVFGWSPDVVREDPRNGIKNVTVAVIDYGLKVKDWIDLEKGGFVNIKAYVTAIPRGHGVYDTVILYSASQLAAYEDDAGKEYQGHGVAVVSALGAVARGVDVVFIEYYNPEIPSEKYGLRFDLAVKWLVEHGDEYNVQIVTTSLSFPSLDPHNIYHSNARYSKFSQLAENYSEPLYEKNYFMVTAAGNWGNQYNYKWEELGFHGYHDKYQVYYFYPQMSRYWFTIGSIDHATIGRYHPTNGRWLDPDYYGIRNHWTGYALYFKKNRAEIEKNQRYDLFGGSSWGDNNTHTNASVDWVMPGNQVPVMSSSAGDRLPNGQRRWVYRSGTSFSAPYFAGIVAILLDGYMDGYRAVGKLAPRLPVNKIVSLLLKASQLSTYNYRIGFGFVDAHKVYRVAYAFGYQEAIGSTGGIPGHSYTIQ